VPSSVTTVVLRCSRSDARAPNAPSRFMANPVSVTSAEESTGHRASSGHGVWRTAFLCAGGDWLVVGGGLAVLVLFAARLFPGRELIFLVRALGLVVRTKKALTISRLRAVSPPPLLVLIRVPAKGGLRIALLTGLGVISMLAGLLTTSRIWFLPGVAIVVGAVVRPGPVSGSSRSAATRRALERMADPGGRISGPANGLRPCCAPCRSESRTPTCVHGRSVCWRPFWS